MISLGRRPRRPLDHLADRGVLLSDLLALLFAQRVDVQEQRLLDLGRVEQVAQALRRHAGVVGQDDRRPQHRGVVRAGQDGPGVEALAAGELLRPRPLRVQRRDEAPAAHLGDDVGGHQARPQHLVSVQLGRPGPQRGRVVDAEAHPREPVAQGLDAHPHAPGDRLLSRERELLATAFAQLGERGGGELDPARRRLVALALGGQERERARQLGVGAGLDQTVHPQVVEGRRAGLGVGGRVDDPERGRGRVLGRPRRVGVERVALVEQGVEQALERLLHQPASGSRASSSSATVASKVGSARAVFTRSTRSIVALSSGIQPRKG